MKRIISIVGALIISATLTACAVTGSVLGSTPEAQITNGANTVTAAATTATVALDRGVIKVNQAKSYRDILRTAESHLKTAAADLSECRARTKSTKETSPDPCKASVADDIELGLKIANDVKSTIDGKTK